MEFYHVLNRGVDKRNIVKDEKDHLRFMQGLFMYNDRNTLARNARRSPTQRHSQKERDCLVHIHAFCLMNNHYHLLLSPVNEDITNLSAFMRKLNMGYAKYFNEKYDRSGALWQGKYKSVLIEKDAHFLYIPYYIHLNPLDQKFPEWREGKVVDSSTAIEFLRTYRWSSLPTYLGEPHYRSITDRSQLKAVLGTTITQQKTIISIITDPRQAADSELLE